MARKRAAADPSLSWRNPGTIVNVMAIFVGIIVASAGSVGGFYYFTQYRVADHETAIKVTIPEQFKQDHQAILDEAKARELARDEFHNQFAAMNSNLAEIKLHAAVQDEKTAQIANTLDKISNQLQSVIVKGR